MIINEISVDFTPFDNKYNRIVFANKNLEQECKKILEGFKEYLSYDHEETTHARSCRIHFPTSISPLYNIHFITHFHLGLSIHRGKIYSFT